MTLTSERARSRLKDAGLRATEARLAVLRALAGSAHPVAHTELVRDLEGHAADQATVYRTLTRFVEVGLARIVSHAGGRARYEYLEASEEAGEHAHPHFLCTDCGSVSCMSTVWLEPPRVESRWTDAVTEATLQFQGRCPDCRQA